MFRGTMNVEHETHVIIGEEKWRVRKRGDETSESAGTWKKWSEVQWSEVKIFGEMCELSLVYIYVTVCRFCAVRCLIITYIYLLFTRLIFFNILFTFVFMFCVFVFYFTYFVCSILFCVFFILLYIAVSLLVVYNFTNHCHRLETHLQ